jgi:hypothetical protein
MRAFRVLLPCALLLSAAPAYADWLVIESPLGGSYTDVVETTLDGDGVVYDAATPAVATGMDLSVYGVVYAGPNTIDDADMRALMDGGAIETFVRDGGVLAVMGAHNTAIEPLGPGGSTFESDLVSVATDEHPTIQDADHELILGTFGGAALADGDFASWGTHACLLRRRGRPGRRRRL